MEQVEFIEHIKTTKPHIVMLGEHHEADSEFRRFACQLIAPLRDSGFQHLALELRDEHRKATDKYCNGTLSFAELSKEFEQISGTQSQIKTFDRNLLESVKEWVETGGSVLYINSLDPPGINVDNDQGRDEFMAKRLASACNDGARIIVLVGRGHTFSRSANSLQMDSTFGVNHLKLSRHLAPTNPLNVSENEREVLRAKAVRKCFLSAAEKLKLQGFKLVSVAEVRSTELIADELIPRGLVLTSTLHTLRERTLPPIRAGTIVENGSKARMQKSMLAPELIHQVFSPKLSEWDAIYFSH